ncbi:apolipoprotein M-like [Centroberyx affinis]|uniref:apolipoprotein M-like n=1 Tax=Centroberyx affinis TaxID=166261 RepID=UPI003A5C338F
MLNRLWSFLLYLYGLLYEVFIPCPVPDLLPANSLNTEQYLGKWYFIAAVSHREADIQMFRAMDSSTFTVDKTSVNGTLLMTGAARIGDKCLKQTWIYYIRPDSDYMEQEGRPVRRTLAWSGTSINCPQCIILQEIEPPLNETEEEDALSRHMLYARQSDVATEVVKAFQAASTCNGMDAIVKLPQEKGLSFI